MKIQNSKIKSQRYKVKIKNFLSLICIFTFLSFIFTFKAAFAADYPVRQAIRVKPIILTPTLIPGQTVRYGFQIDNLLNQPIGIGASLSPLDASDEDTGMRFDHPTPNNELIKWTSLSEKNFIIPAGESYYISLAITTPAHPSTMQQNAILFLTPFISKPLDPNTPTIVSKIGVLVFAHVGEIKATDVKKAVTIPTFSFGGIVDETIPQLLLRVENNYPTIITAKPTVEITPLFGKKQKISLEEKRVLPGHIRRWIQPIALTTLNHFFYQTTIFISVGEGQQIMARTWFIMFPIRKAGIAVLILLTLGFIIWRRKQLKKAGLILLGKEQTPPIIKEKTKPSPVKKHPTRSITKKKKKST